MTSSAVGDRDTVLGALASIETALNVLAAASLDGFTPPELLELLARREVIARRGPALDHRIIHGLRSQARPGELGSTTWPKVLAERLQVSAEEASRRLTDAADLGPRTAVTGEALAPVLPHFAAAQAHGQVGAEHLRITRKFFKKLPAAVDRATRVAAEKDLAQRAVAFGPEEYRKAADFLAALLHPDGDFDDADRQRRRGATMGRQSADGLTEFTATMSPECRAVWEPIFAKLDAPGMCNPADENPCVTGRPTAEQIAADTRSPAQRRHDALVAAGRIVLSTKSLGDLNGLPVTVIVTTTLAELEAGAGTALTGGGSRMPMRDLIRNAAEAYHYLAVFDGDGKALHLGRSKRTASVAQRIMLHARDHGCTKPGCIAAGYRCQVHHLESDWAEDGVTDIDKLTLACGPDNRMCTEFHWDTHLNEHGRVEWIPPPGLDHGQPRINTMHHPQDLLAPHPDPSGIPDRAPVRETTPIIERPCPTTEPDRYDDEIFEYLLAIDPDPDGLTLWQQPIPHNPDNWPDDDWPDDQSAYYHGVLGLNDDPDADAYDDWHHNLDPDLISALDAYSDLLDEDVWQPVSPCHPPDWDEVSAGSIAVP